MIFGSVEAMNNAAHVLEVIDATLDKLDGIEHADIIDKDGKIFLCRTQTLLSVM